MRPGWDGAFKCGGRIVATRALGHIVPRENAWDYRALDGILAIVFQGLADQQGVPPTEVRLVDVLAVLEDGPDAVRRLAGDLLGQQWAHAVDIDVSQVPGPFDPAMVCWQWLTRAWPNPPADGGAQFSGLVRHASCGPPGAVVDVMVGWALRAVLEHQAQALPGDFVAVDSSLQ